MFPPHEAVSETIYPFPEPPWVEPHWEIENVGEKREDVKTKIATQVEAEQQRGACVVFTDGSYIPKVGSGAAIAMTNRTYGQAYGPLEGISNYETETMALMITMVKFKQITDTHPNKFKSLAIFSDIQASLNLMAKPMTPKTLQYLARFLLRTHRHLRKLFEVRFYWTPGHEEIEMNERADKATKEAAESNEDPVTLPISLGCLMRRAREKIQTRGAPPISPYKTKSKWISDALHTLEKGQAASIFQLRCGHNPLQKFLHRIGAEDSDRCAACSAKGTAAHFLIYCKQYRTQRQAFQRQLKEEMIKVDFNSATKLLDTPAAFPYFAQYVQATGRFTHLKTYLEVSTPGKEPSNT